MVIKTDDANVLICYTGGTIGMLNSQNGYVPEPGFLTATLKAQSRFHDPAGDSLLSHTSSSTAFLNWSSSTSSSSASASRPGSRSNSPGPSSVNLPRFIVRSSVTDDEPASGTDKDGVRYKEERLEALVTPPVDKGGRRIRYCVLEYTPLIDSSNVSLTDWIRLASDIALNYASFDGFLLLHGTDTMSYTASALSFLLEDLGKPVIVTGAQIPISQLRNDAYSNLLGGLIIAGTFPTFPEVGLFFDGNVWRGNRTTKISNESFAAFGSAGEPGALIKAGINLEVNWNAILRPKALRPFKAHRGMSPDVAILRVFPGITASFLHGFLNASTSSPLKGVVLETFGAGNAPERDDIMNELRQATQERGLVIVNVTQCSQGFVSKTYSGGWALERAGVVAGGDMTTECALAKLSYLLSKSELSLTQVRHLIGIPLRGEISVPQTASSGPALTNGLDRFQSLLEQAANLAETSSSSFIVGTNECPPSMDPAHPPPSTPFERPAPASPLPSAKNMPSLSASALSNDDSHVAAWSRTPHSAAVLERALLPALLASAVSKNDAFTLRTLLDTERLTGGAAVSGGPSSTSPLQFNPVHGLNEVGMTLLHVAAIRGAEACARVLLEHGATVHGRDLLGHTPLYYATRQSHESTASLLKTAGAMFAGTDAEGMLAELAEKERVRRGGHVGPPAQGSRGRAPE